MEKIKYDAQGNEIKPGQEAPPPPPKNPLQQTMDDLQAKAKEGDELAVRSYALMQQLMVQLQNFQRIPDGEWEDVKRLIVSPIMTLMRLNAKQFGPICQSALKAMAVASQKFNRLSEERDVAVGQLRQMLTIIEEANKQEAAEAKGEAAVPA